MIIVRLKTQKLHNEVIEIDDLLWMIETVITTNKGGGTLIKNDGNSNMFAIHYGYSSTEEKCKFEEMIRNLISNYYVSYDIISV